MMNVRVGLLENNKARIIAQTLARHIAGQPQPEECRQAEHELMDAAGPRQKVNVLACALERINSLDWLSDLHEEWDRLVERFRNPLLCHDWFSSCAAAFCPPGRLDARMLRSNGKIRAIAPLVRQRRLGIDHFELLGTSYLMEPTSLLFDNTSSLEQLFDGVLDLKSPLFLTRLIPEPDVEEVLHASAKKKSFLVIEHRNSSPWIPIDSTWKEFEARMPSRRRSDLRRVRRRLEMEGVVELEVHSEESHDFSRALDEAFRIEASGWKAKRGTAILSNEKLKAFFTVYAAAAARSGIVRLFLLKVKGRGIAMVLGVEYARRLWILKVGYDEYWAHFSPGILLHHETIRWAFEHQLEGYEFLGTTEPWMQMWTESKHTYSTYRVIPKSLKGLLWLGIEGTRVLLKKSASMATRLSMIVGLPSWLEVIFPPSCL